MKNEIEVALRAAADAVEDQMAEDDNMPIDIARAAITAFFEKMPESWEIGTFRGVPVSFQCTPMNIISVIDGDAV